VLAALAAHCTKAIFFPIGLHATYEPQILKQVAAAGHAIGSHTWCHQDLSKTKGTCVVNGKLLPQQRRRRPWRVRHGRGTPQGEWSRIRKCLWSDVESDLRETGKSDRPCRRRRNIDDPAAHKGAAIVESQEWGAALPQ
jgi:peptidoglycan/xylan/chitin deacetylase (PgdA/CDA1 family)